MSLLAEPHHDGSPLYLPDPSPALGGTATVRLRTRPDAGGRAADDGPGIDRVWLRTTYDAEPTFHECVRVPPPAGRDDGGIWWQGRLPVHNPRTHYRFLLAYADGSQAWLSAAGVVGFDAPDSADFVLSTHDPAPAWTKDAVVYQIFPDRFARSAAADSRPTPGWAKPQAWDEPPSYLGTDDRTWLGLYGGDLDGIVEHLDHVAEVGASVVYLTPVFPGESNHRYNASTFDRVDDLLGGDEAYARLSDALHERGWHLLGDLTINHTGDTHEWFVAAQADPAAPTRAWYCFGPDGSYESWMGHDTLPKLDHTDPDLRAAMVAGPDSVVARWMRAPYRLDGWRIDVANMTGRLGAVDVNHEVARTVRRTATAERADAWVIGEHNHDASGDLDLDGTEGGWHGTMNYSGFSWPVWSWLRAEQTAARPFGRPVPVPRRSGRLLHRALTEWRARYGWRAAAQSWNILSSHDSARIRTLVGDPARHRVAAGLQFTLPGVPMVFAGDELGLEGVNGEDGRRPMPWARRAEWDTDTLAAYGRLARLRREHPALIEGGLRWAYVDDDTLVYLREHPDGTLLVAVRRAAGPAVELEAPLLELAGADLLLATEPGVAAADAALRSDEETVLVPAADGPGCWVWGRADR
ncbi:MAG: glycoside hydrolase family 13 protein [Nocardioides sp.]|uniref:glycoside hydrolase family 13 protein n=1 Tax=Nocardioides sp. TaxID=35761 RepID=UPI0039E56589